MGVPGNQCGGQFGFLQDATAALLTAQLADLLAQGNTVTTTLETDWTTYARRFADTLQDHGDLRSLA